jgi:hypothetical protein
MYSAQHLRNSLEAFKRDVIGLVKNQDRFDLIVYKHNEDFIDTFTISQFGAIHENFRFPISYGEVKYFPKGKSMDEMLDNPFELDAFIKSFS